jgi:hypothetical protein
MLEHITVAQNQGHWQWFTIIAQYITFAQQ